MEDFDPTAERTMRWVNEDSESPVVQESSDSPPDRDSAVEEVLGIDHLSTDGKVSGDQLQTRNNSTRELPQSEAEARPASLDWETDTHTQVLTDPQTDTDAQVQGVRTRAGRVAKKANRLIESMVQKPFYIRGVESHLKKRTGSLLLSNVFFCMK